MSCNQGSTNGAIRPRHCRAQGSTDSAETQGHRQRLPSEEEEEKEEGKSSSGENEELTNRGLTPNGRGPFATGAYDCYENRVLWYLHTVLAYQSHVVLLSTVGGIAGFGVRPLSWSELAALWDVPILISDCLSEALGVDLLRGFCLSAPAKVLFVGADALLTTSFRGVLRGVLLFLPLRVWVTLPGRPPRQMWS